MEPTPPTRQTLADLTAGELRQHADKLADWYQQNPLQRPDHPRTLLPYGIRQSGHTRAGRHQRLISARWWRRTLYRRARQHREHHRIAAGAVGGGQTAYTSAAGLREHQAQQMRQIHWAWSRSIRGEDGSQRSLYWLVQGQAERTWAELYTFMAGLEALAEDRHLVPLWLTLTLPPEWHPNPSSGRNTWNGTDPRTAKDALQERWGLLTRDLRRYCQTPPLGLRVREPHQDACPHDHALLYVQREDVELVTDLIRRRYPGQRAAQIEEITSARPRSYVAKYISKHSTDQTSDDDDEEETPTDRVAAWRTTWTIRAFSFIGLPRGARTLWRYLRKLPEEPEDPETAEHRRAAKAGDAAAYLRALMSPSPSPTLYRVTVTDGYGDPDTRAAGIVTPEGEILTGPTYEITTDDTGETPEPHIEPTSPVTSPLPTYTELAKAGGRALLHLHDSPPG